MDCLGGLILLYTLNNEALPLIKVCQLISVDVIGWLFMLNLKKKKKIPLY